MTSIVGRGAFAASRNSSGRGASWTFASLDYDLSALGQIDNQGWLIVERWLGLREHIAFSLGYSGDVPLASYRASADFIASYKQYDIWVGDRLYYLRRLRDAYVDVRNALLSDPAN